MPKLVGDQWMSKHRNKLRAYLFDVTRDMLERGAINQRTSARAVQDILRHELKSVLVEVNADLTAVLREVGAELASAGAQVLGSIAARGLEGAGSALGDILARAISGRKKS